MGFIIFQIKPRRNFFNKMKNKICKKCGTTEEEHSEEITFSCKKFELLITDKMGQSSKPKKFEAQDKEWGVGGDNIPKNHSHPEDNSMSSKSKNIKQSSGSDNSPKVGVLDAVKSVMDKPEDTLSSKIDKLEKSWSWLLNPDYKDVHYKVIDDVRELNKDFIKKLKEEFRTKMERNIIDKLAGEELLE